MEEEEKQEEVKEEQEEQPISHLDKSILGILNLIGARSRITIEIGMDGKFCVVAASRVTEPIDSEAETNEITG